MRMFLPLFISSLALLGFSAEAADGKLVLPEHFELVTVNGQPQGGLLTGKHKVSLEAGQHIIEVEYNDLLEDDDSDSHTKLRSTAQAFNLEVEAGHHYLLQAQRPDDVDAAQAFAANPVFRIKDETRGQYLALNVVSAEQRQASLLRQMLGATENKPVKALVAAKPEADAAADKPQQASKSAAVQKPQRELANVEQQLLYWWQQASPAQRQRFLTQVLSD